MQLPILGHGMEMGGAGRNTLGETKTAFIEVHSLMHTVGDLAERDLSYLI